MKVLSEEVKRCFAFLPSALLRTKFVCHSLSINDEKPSMVSVGSFGPVWDGREAVLCEVGSNDHWPWRVIERADQCARSADGWASVKIVSWRRGSPSGRYTTCRECSSVVQKRIPELQWYERVQSNKVIKALPKVLRKYRVA